MKNSIKLLSAIFFLLLNSCSKDLENSTSEPDISAPTLDFTIAGFTDISSDQPVIVSNQIEVNIAATDAGGISKIEAFIDDQKMGEDSSAPYSIIIDVSSLASKTGKAKIYKNYTLKIVASDKTGNSVTKQVTINVDNEKPAITEVSLEEGSIINGNTNGITFDLMDNEVLSSVKAFLNNDLLPEISLDSLAININTTDLTDGPNVLKIEAIDAAENIGIYEVSFVSDNTGPQITIQSLVENQIIDELITLNPDVSDLYSDVTLLKIFYGDSSLISFENQVDFSFDFDPIQFPAGLNSVKFVATDNLGNISELLIPISIYRQLITINFPPNYFDPQ